MWPRLQISGLLHSWRFTYWLPQIFCTSNPSCTIVLSFQVAFQTLRWLADVWHRPFLGISSRRHFACFCWWHLQNCFGNCGDSSPNRYSSYFPDDLRNLSKKATRNCYKLTYVYCGFCLILDTSIERLLKAQMKMSSTYLCRKLSFSFISRSFDTLSSQ